MTTTPSSSPPKVFLYKYKPALNLVSADPECITVEAYLRLAGIEFQTLTSGNPLMSPTQNLPLLKQGPVAEGGARNIVEHLKTRHVDLDDHLSHRERVECDAFVSLILEKLQLCILYNWWSETQNYKQVISKTSFYDMSWLSRLYMVPIQRMRIQSRLQRAGIMQNRSHVINSLREVLRALSLLLGDGPYFYGNRPSSLDAFAYGHLACLLYPVDMPVDDMRICIRDEFPSLVSFCERITERVFTDFKPQKQLSDPPRKASRKDKQEDKESEREREFRRGSQRFLFFSGLSIAAYFALLYGRVLSTIVQYLSESEEDEEGEYIDDEEDDLGYDYEDDQEQ